MALDEAMRHRIHDRFEALLGSEEAAALMAAMPPIEVATKADIENLSLKFDRALADLGSTLRIEMNHQFRFMVQWTTGSIFAAGSLGLAAGRILAG